MATPEYILDTDSFFAPHYIAKGTKIAWDGPPGPHMIAANDEAKAKLAEYYKERPDASIHPVEQLPMVMVVAPEPTPTAAALDLSAVTPNPIGDPEKPNSEPEVKAEVDAANAKATEPSLKVK